MGETGDAQAEDLLLPCIGSERSDSSLGGGSGMFVPMFLLTSAHMRHLSPHFSLAQAASHMADRRVLSGIIDVIRHGLQWRDTPSACGPNKTLYDRFVRCGRLSSLDRILIALAAEAGHRSG